MDILYNVLVDLFNEVKIVSLDYGRFIMVVSKVNRMISSVEENNERRFN